MQIQINYGDVKASDALSDHIHRCILHALKHLQHRLTRVEVHIRDDRSKRNGRDDLRCMMEARIAGKGPLVATHRSHDFYQAVSNAAEKLGRVVAHAIPKR